jgi:hypothetical protein
VRYIYASIGREGGDSLKSSRLGMGTASLQIFRSEFKAFCRAAAAGSLVGINPGKDKPAGYGGVSAYPRRRSRQASLTSFAIAECEQLTAGESPQHTTAHGKLGTTSPIRSSQIITGIDPTTSYIVANLHFLVFVGYIMN